MDKDADAYRTISEVAQALDIPPHVLRFWETRFPQIRPLKRGGGRRYYRRGDTDLLRMIRRLLYDEGYTIRGVQRLLKSKGAGALAARGVAEEGSAGPGEMAVPADGGIVSVTASARPHCARDTITELVAQIAACRIMLGSALETSEGDPETLPRP